jgi:Na+-transporting NADH:ubiquinone oxidoreductase subunit NqrC
MVGRPQRKVYCQGFTRAGRRIGKLIPCGMKGYQLANGTFYCKYHGYQNVKGFKKANYTDQTRIKQLSKLIQFKNYTNEQLKIYYEEKIRPTLIDGGKSEYHRRATRKRTVFGRNIRGQAVSIQLDEVLRLLKKKSRTRDKNIGS